ncbi:hypothetical protein SPRG_11373 [Saprolegnia parasitica CBS 223.65]|uniref:Uncharacterized protein n=1 Tax=Saprolegnia parasitica (strain CBS 223.65) TaxID=695850 RepID=A0A067C2T2_SAPPC|nr:hypothetical protein SPRG_11373 [Saprolegnia parasitica CBS 223.65]KDO23450.1 hypothetical protein SPRG_11373 [Saprolegnia parasitica CBS 223.65]|eukprot:XP_012205769.1 hypothetical protein SPRG_11373 [Saprolegnia parasitica CBS 223.65]
MNSPIAFDAPVAESIDHQWISSDDALHQVKDASSLGAWMLDTALDVGMSQLQSTQVYLRI